jgi:hypothetical protein
VGGFPCGEDQLYVHSTDLDTRPLVYLVAMRCAIRGVPSRGPVSVRTREHFNDLIASDITRESPFNLKDDDETV